MAERWGPWMANGCPVIGDYIQAKVEHKETKAEDFAEGLVVKIEDEQCYLIPAFDEAQSYWVNEWRKRIGGSELEAGMKKTKKRPKITDDDLVWPLEKIEMNVDG